MQTAVTFTQDDVSFVRNVVRSIVSPSDAHDVAQHALMIAFVKQHQFRGDSRYRTWLFQIARNVALGHLRTLRRRTSNELLLEHELLPEVQTPFEALGHCRRQWALRTRVRAMNPSSREVLSLRYLDELSEEEVARRLRITVANVKIRAFRGRALLRASLTESSSA